MECFPALSLRVSRREDVREFAPPAVATLTTTSLNVDPPAPVQVRINVELAVSVPVDCEPLVAFDPLQPPDAVQLVVLVELHVRVEDWPDETEVGEADIVRVGSCTEVTVTVALCVALHTAPVQVKINVELAVSIPVDCEPLTTLVPLQPP